MCYLLMLSILLPINSNQPERMWAGQEIQSSLCNTCLSFIQNELRPMPGEHCMDQRCNCWEGSSLLQSNDFQRPCRTGMLTPDMWLRRPVRAWMTTLVSVAEGAWGEKYIHLSQPTLRCVGRKIFHC